jgi:NitT/TauT family transport system permease protein
MTAPATATTAPARPWLDGLAVLAIGLVLWQALHAVAGDVAISPPLRTIGRAAAMLGDGAFWTSVGATFHPFALALGIEAVAGVLLGAALGLHRLAGAVVEPLLVGFYGVPKIVFFPVILLLFGIGVESEVVFALLHGILPITLFTMNATRSIRPVYLKTGRALRLSRWQTIRHIALPAVVPEVFSGLRIGFAVTLLGVLLCEMFGSKNGLGFLLMNAMGGNRVDEIMALILLLVGFAVGANLLLLAIDRRLHRRV